MGTNSASFQTQLEGRRTELQSGKEPWKWGDSLLAV